MKKMFSKSFIFLLMITLAAGITLIGCDEMADENHNTEEGRNGANGFSLIMTITPSRAPSNNDATMNVHCRLIRLADLGPVPNTRIRLALEAYNYALDPDVVGFIDDTLLTDLVTDANGEASVTLYVGTLPRSVSEVKFGIDAQATVEYEYYNSITVWAMETFYIYNPFWDGTRTPDNDPPTAVITFFPSTGITPGTTITFMGANSYDRGTDEQENPKAYDEIRQYSWNFADGSYGSGKTVTHLYAAEGTYTVELMVVDDEGMTGQTTASVTVSN